jgi:putative holliday junction resolvase
MRAVGVDVGGKRIGLAVSDASGTLARPLGSVTVAALDAAAIARVEGEIARLRHEDDGVATLVVGLPRRLDGRATEMTSVVEAFARRLAQACALPLVLQDERLSSYEAESRLATREKDWRVRKRKLDAAAAAVILQDYLDACASAGRGTGRTDETDEEDRS